MGIVYDRPDTTGFAAAKTTGTGSAADEPGVGVKKTMNHKPGSVFDRHLSGTGLAAALYAVYPRLTGGPPVCGV